MTNCGVRAVTSVSVSRVRPSVLQYHVPLLHVPNLIHLHQAHAVLLVKVSRDQENILQQVIDYFLRVLQSSG